MKKTKYLFKTIDDLSSWMRNKSKEGVVFTCRKEKGVWLLSAYEETNHA